MSNIPVSLSLSLTKLLVTNNSIITRKNGFRWIADYNRKESGWGWRPQPGDKIEVNKGGGEKICATVIQKI